MNSGKKERRAEDEGRERGESRAELFGLASLAAGSRPPSALPPPLSAPPPPPAAGSARCSRWPSPLPLAAGEPAGARVQERPSGARRSPCPEPERTLEVGARPIRAARGARTRDLLGKTCPKNALQLPLASGGGPKESEV